MQGRPTCDPAYIGIGVLVYPSAARDFDAPRSCYSVDEEYYGYIGLAIDSAGDLYVPNGYDRVSVYAYARSSSPVLIRTVTGKSFKASRSVAVDSQDRMWVLNNQSYSYVARYKAYVSGNVLPQATVAFATKQHWSGNIAVDDKYLYVGGNRQILVYPKFAEGRVYPLADLNVPQNSGSYLAIAK